MSDSGATGEQPKKAVVLLSGGLDSTTVLAMAQAQGFECFCISFDYGQRHLSEIEHATRIAAQLRAAEHRVVRIDIGQFGGSALTDDTIDVPVNGEADGAAAGATSEIPVTYVPARNTVFLSYALGFAEVLGSLDIFIGVNAVDYSGYPDCRPEFIKAFETMANLATRTGVEGNAIHIHTPLMHLDKASIIKAGVQLGIDYSMTVSCYQLSKEGLACGVCDSCRLRKAGFDASGHADPTRYLS